MFYDPKKPDWRDDVEAIREESRMAGGILEIQTLLTLIDKQAEIIRLGVEMREKQKAYFKSRAQQDLIISKQAEAEFDFAVKQANLFGDK